MRTVGLRCPDGSWVPVHDRTEIGRGFRGLLDENASRIQFEINAIEGSGEPCLHLQAVGVNPLVVEAPGHAGPGEPGYEWELRDFLDPGQDALVAAGSRFFIASRQQTSTFVVEEGPMSGGAGIDSSSSPRESATFSGNNGTPGGSQSPELQLQGGRGNAVEDPHPTGPLPVEATDENAAVEPPCPDADDAPRTEPRRRARRSPEGSPRTPRQVPSKSKSPPRKRAKMEVQSADASHGDRTWDPSHAYSVSQLPTSEWLEGPDPLGYCGFALTRVRGLSDSANRAWLGVRLRDVITGPFRWALLSNYMIDTAWLLSGVPALLRPDLRLLVVHGERDSRADDIKASLNAAGIANAVVHAPYTPQFGTMHTKAAILEYAEGEVQGVRVIVLTGNFIYPDLNNKTQAIWWQDFPVKDPDSPESSSFEEDLLEYINAMRLPYQSAREARDLIARHDFSSARATLVGSVPGPHKGRNLSSWGHMKVRKELAKQTFDAAFKGSASALVAQFSSLGSLTDKWLTDEFRTSLSSGLCQARDATSPKAQTPSTGVLGPTAGGRSGLQLVWPTVEEVRNSVEGWAAGASVPGPAKNVQKPFLQPYYHPWGGAPAGRQRAMPHMKSYTRYREQGMAFFMTGSHNLSKAAWGELQVGGSQVGMRSYELSVLLLPSTEAAYRRHRHYDFSLAPFRPGRGTPRASPVGVEFRTLASLEGSAGARTGNVGQEQSESDNAGASSVTMWLPVPYALPPKPYAGGDKPWAVDVPFSGVDALGFDIYNRPLRHYGNVEPDAR